MRNYFQNRKGQGTTEYIVILAVVVAIAIAVIKTNLKTELDKKVAAIANSISTQ